MPSVAEAKRFKREIEAIAQFVQDNPDTLEDPTVASRAFSLVRRACGGNPELAQREITRRYLKADSDLRKVLRDLKNLKQPMYTPAWILGGPTTHRSNGSDYKVVQAIVISGGHPGQPRFFKVVENPLGDGDNGQDSNGTGKPGRNGRSPPYLGLVDPTAGLYISSLEEQDLPDLLLLAEEKQVSSVEVKTQIPGIGQIKVVERDGSEGKSRVFCAESLARQSKEMIESGEAVTVDVACGIAQGIVTSRGKVYESFVQFRSAAEIPPIGEMVWPRKLHKEFKKDVRYTLQGRPVCVDLVGPTGTGKSEAALRNGGEAARAKNAREVVFLDISPSSAGTAYVHEYARTMARAFRLAAKFADDPRYQPVILMDEGDDVLGQGDGYAYAHNDEERFALQRLLTNIAPGVMVYVTRNIRRHRSLPPEMAGRLKTREFPLPNRETTSRVAALYCTAEVAARFGLTKEAFGQRVADSMFSSHRVLGVAHFHSGARVPVRVCDLHQLVAPRNVKTIVQSFCWDVEDGEIDSLEALFSQIDELRVPDLSARNFWELTTLQRPNDDTLRSVELNRA